MRKNKLYRYERLSHYFKEGAQEEARAWINLIKTNWAWVLLFVCGAASLIYLAQPWPPKQVHLAVGQPDSAYEILGREFQGYFRSHGIDLKLQNTSGSRDSLKQLVDPDSPVKAAFLMSGSAARGEFQNIVSLGSLQYLPLWIFYRGDIGSHVDPLHYFSERRIAIGTHGSGTQYLLKQMIALRGFESKIHKNYLELPHAKAEQDLLDGKIDAMCVVDSIYSPVIQKLLHRDGINILDFKLVPAYAKKLPFLEPLTIPKASLDLKKFFPIHDVQLAATTMSLLVNHSMHPAIQQMFLMAAVQISGDRNHFFAHADYFPIYLDRAIPLSDTAKSFYDKGPPSLTHIMPFWLASFVDRMWLSILAIFAMLLPLYRLIPRYRRFHSDLVINGAYEELKRIDSVMLSSIDLLALDKVLAELQDLETEIADTWISSDNLNDYYSLRKAIDHVRQQANHKLNKITNMES